MVGIIWVFQAPLCSVTTPTIYRMVLAVSILRIIIWGLTFLSVCCMSCCFCMALWLHNATARALLASFNDQRVPTRPLAPEAVSAIPTATYDAQNFAEDDRRCPVCLADYAEGDVVARLPCTHHFHQGCINMWWERESTCPVWYVSFSVDCLSVMLKVCL